MRTFSSTGEVSAGTETRHDDSTSSFGSFGRVALSVAAVAVAGVIAFAAIRATDHGLPRSFDLGEGASSTPGDGSVLVVSQVASVDTSGGEPGPVTSPDDPQGGDEGLDDPDPSAGTTTGAERPSVPGETEIPAAPTGSAPPDLPPATTAPTVPLPGPGDELVPGVETPEIDVDLPLLPPITVPPVTTPPVTIPDLGLG